MIRRRTRFTTITCLDRRSELSGVGRRELVVVANKWLILWCPCDTGHLIHLNLDPRRQPCWTLDTIDLTVRPSVVATRPERRCHYHITSGQVWVCVDDDTATESRWRRRVRALTATLRR